MTVFTHCFPSKGSFWERLRCNILNDHKWAVQLDEDFEAAYAFCPSCGKTQLSERY